MNNEKLHYIKVMALCLLMGVVLLVASIISAFAS
jgi:hypothetical protein